MRTTLAGDGVLNGTWVHGEGSLKLSLTPCLRAHKHTHTLLYTRYTVKGAFLEAEVMYRRAIDLNNMHLPAICNYGTLLKNELDDLEGAILL